MPLNDPIKFGKHSAVIVGASWDKTSQQAHIVFSDEDGKERTTRATGMSPREIRKAVLDEMVHAKWPAQR